MFIRRPFLYMAWAYGLMGGLGATLVITIVCTLVHTKLQELIMLYYGGHLAGLNYPIIGVATLGVAITICLSGTGIALVRQKRKLLDG